MHIQRTISRVLAAAVASSGFVVVPIPVHAASLTCTSTSFTASADSAGNITVNCTSPSTGSTCSISVSPTSLPASGGTVNVSTSCGANTSVTGGKALAATSTTTWTDAIPANTSSTSQTFTYSVTGDGGSNQASVVEAGSGSPPPPIPGGTISCAGYSKTIVLDLNWGAPSSGAPRLTTTGFGNDAIVVARFTTPANTAPGVFATISSGEWGDQPTFRTAALSTTPCDFTSPNPLGRYATLIGSQEPAVVYAVGGTSRVYAILQPSTTYYLNIKNVNALGAPSCTSTTCNMFVELQKPNGL